jgi:hypothetical protein
VVLVSDHLYLQIFSAADVVDRHGGFSAHETQVYSYLPQIAFLLVKSPLHLSQAFLKQSYLLTLVPDLALQLVYLPLKPQNVLGFHQILFLEAAQILFLHFGLQHVDGFLKGFVVEADFLAVVLQLLNFSIFGFESHDL